MLVMGSTHAQANQYTLYVTCANAYLQEGHMVHNRPVRKAILITQVAQVVAVAPHLFCELRVGHGGASHILPHSVAMLHQPLAQLPNVLQHLHRTKRLPDNLENSLSMCLGCWKHGTKATR